jgi:hypothetical protein
VEGCERWECGEDEEVVLEKTERKFRRVVIENDENVEKAYEEGGMEMKTGWSEVLPSLRGVEGFQLLITRDPTGLW